MKFQLLAFIFPTLACVHFLLAASWFLFALFGPLFFTFMSVQLLTSFYLKILYSILSLSRALSGPLIFLFNLSVQLLIIFTHNLRRFVSAILSL